MIDAAYDSLDIMQLYQITRRLGWPLLGLLCLLPVVRWAVMMPLELRFDGFVTTMLSIGQLAGLVGFTMFAFNLLLTTRIKLFEDLFGGLNKVFIAHHLIGTLALFGLMAHPLLMSLRLAPVSMRDAALLLVPNTGNVPVALGILALTGLLTLLFITYFGTLRYHSWLLTHKFLGGVFFVASLHVFLTPNDLSNDRLLQWYMLGLAALGLGAYAYRTLFPGIFAKRYSYTVQSARQLNKATVQIQMVPVRRGIQFEAGQFIFVSFRVPGMSAEWHPFTVSSAPHERGLAITVKSLGRYTEALLRALPTLNGAQVKVEGAYGRFGFRRAGGPNQIWIAGGIGITPFLALAKDLMVSEREFHVDLYYAVRTESELVEFETLQSQASGLSGRWFRVIPFVSTKQGLLTAKYVEVASEGVTGKEILICGPAPMMTALRQQFREAGVKTKNIHTEEFTLQ